MSLKIKKFKLVNNIDSILQVTKNMIQQSENYHDYLINKNNNLYLKQLPLLMHSRRINSVFSSRLNKIKKLKSAKDPKNINSLMENEEEKQTTKKKLSMPSLLPLYQIRNIKIRSKKLPPLCPLFNQKGELVRSMIASNKIRNKIVYEDEKSIYSSISFSSSRNKHKILSKNYSQIVKNLKKTEKSFENRTNVDINLDIDNEKYEFENFFANDEEYKKLTYDESEIFGKINKKHNK